jgi:hypothetical protein
MEKLNLSQTIYTSRDSNSPFNNRNIEPHGIEKYLATLERKNADKYNEILNNRIAKLLKEEENTKKQIQNAQKRAIVIMKNRERIHNEKKEKEKLKTFRKQQEEALRIKNFMEREKRKKNLNDIQQFIYIQKQSAVLEIKKNGDLGHTALTHFKNIIEHQKAEKVQIMKFQMEAKKEFRSKSTIKYKSSLRKQYEQSIEEEKKMYLKSLSKRKELEAMESQLLQKISESQVLAGNFTPQSFSQHHFSTSN